MRKCIIFLSVIALMVGFIVIGCSNDDSSSSVPTGITEDDIIGIWALTSITTDTVETHDDHIPSYMLEFAAEGVGNQNYRGSDAPFQWSLTDDQITISTWFNAGIVSGNKITYTFDEEDFTIVQVYTKQ
ncbi:MAG: hypothetical protein HQ568_11830 [Calditrichaeota bacterium]|nr:hypothetical protein [Calditrichota bacterium]